MKSPKTSAFVCTALVFVALWTGCASAPVAEHRAFSGRFQPLGQLTVVEKPGLVMTIRIPPRGIQDQAFLAVDSIAGVLYSAQLQASSGNKMDGAKTSLAEAQVQTMAHSANKIVGTKARITATECAVINETDGQEYELLVISPDQTAEAVGRAVYCVVLWNKVGIDWYAEILFDVSWQSANKPYAKIVYRNTKDDSCLFVENGSNEGSWKVAQEMKFGKGVPPKEHATMARSLSNFPRHKSSHQRR